MEDKIKYKDLSGWLKVAIVVGWTQLVLFIIGFILGFLGLLTI